MRTITIFISSPGDVAEERVLTRKVLRRVEGWFSGRARIEAMFWEDEAMRVSGTFQEQIPSPADSHVMICILWARLGTLLHEKFRRPDGSRYQSGTEWEFEMAMQGFTERGFPEMLVYRKTAAPVVSLDLDTDKLIEMRRQHQNVDDFMEKWFMTTGEISFKSAFTQFETIAEFEEKVENHVRDLIEDRLDQLGESAEKQRPRAWWKGSPFTGLRAFTHEEAPVFFGRTQAIHGALAALRRRSVRGLPFLLLLGMSGCGKSSVARAGVVPLITESGVIEGVGLWRRTVFCPGDASNPIKALVYALVGEHALPGLPEISEWSLDELAEKLRHEPGTVHQIVRSALVAVAEEHAAAEKLEQAPEARLVIIVDQLEELFTKPGLDDADRRAFARALAALMEGDLVWVVATLRSDFYHRLPDVPELIALKERGTQYDVLPPTPAEIGQMIRQPAIAAGLTFQQQSDSGARLDDRLRDAASADPAALPLLAFALAELYERRDGVTLTDDAYDAIGGLEGALAGRAEEAFSGLPPAARASFPSFMRLLVRAGTGLDASITRNDAPRTQLEALPGGHEFVEAFVGARMLSAYQAQDGTPMVRVAHEALLRRWKRVINWLEHDRELLHIRARVDEAAKRWEAEGKTGDLLLPAGKPLEEAQQLVEEAGFGLEPVHRECVAASTAHAAARRRLKRLAIAGLAVLTVIAGVAAFVANEQRKETAELHVVAKEGRLLAEESLLVVDLPRRADEELWPIEPAQADAFAAWIEETESLVGRKRELHAPALAELDRDGGGGTLSEEEVAARRAGLEKLVEDVTQLEEETLPPVRERLTCARLLRRHWLDEPDPAWERARAGVAAASVYAALAGKLDPQPGLVPLGADPTSGLQEFAYALSGTIPVRGADGKLVLHEDTALVFVLIPPGEFLMGAQKDDKTAANYDPWIYASNTDVHAVTIDDAFFLSKYEATKSQWARLSSAQIPTTYADLVIAGEGPDEGLEAGESGHPSPETLIPRNDADRFLWHHGLTLPTEQQWEYACRARNQRARYYDDSNDVPFYDTKVEDKFNDPPGRTEEYEWYYDKADPYKPPHPVGLKRANGFGLHDMLGNVSEWCANEFYLYPGSKMTAEQFANGVGVTRGGDIGYGWAQLRTAARNRQFPEEKSAHLGIRPARPVRAAGASR